MSGTPDICFLTIDWRDSAFQLIVNNQFFPLFFFPLST